MLIIPIWDFYLPKSSHTLQYCKILQYTQTQHEIWHWPILHQGTLTCAGSCAGRAGCSSSDTGLSLLVVNATFDAVSASFSVELCSELVLLVGQLLFLGMPYDTTPAVFVAVTEKILWL